MYTDFFIPSSYGFSKKKVENHKIKKLPPKDRGGGDFDFGWCPSYELL